MAQPDPFLDRLADLIGKARAAGADAADAVLISSASLAVARRLGKPEHLERSESADVGLRVFIGRRQAIVSSSDLSASGLAELPERAVAMARSVPEDPYCGLAEPELLAGSDVPDLDMCDTAEPDAEALFALYQFVVFTGLSQEPPRPQAMLARLAGFADLLMTGLAKNGD